MSYTDDSINHILQRTVDELSDTQRMAGLFHQHHDGDPLPSIPVLQEIIGLCRAVLLPGYYGQDRVNSATVHFHIGVEVERLFTLLTTQIEAGLCFGRDGADGATEQPCRHKAAELAAQLIAKLPEVRSTLATDVEAAYEGDPAAVSQGEIISCYPVIKALTNYRIAHVLFELGVPLIPRMMTELAHSETGIDIHPEATIGKHFTIDHGTGVVIGATCIIGNNVKLYQGVTLGAKSFPLDKDGNPIKGIPRHPILENDVIVYANATILGRITIGEGCVVGANVWVTKDMKPKTKKYKKEKQSLLDIEFNNGTGI